MTDMHRGTCFCGAVTIEVKGAPEEMGYCHCASCRSYSGAPLVTFTLWRDENVHVIRGSEHLGSFRKSAMSERRFCTKCGGHVMVKHPGLGCTDIPAGILPTLPFKPSLHLNYAETVMPMRDGVLKLRDFPAHVGGSGETMHDELCDIPT